ncbi:N-6 DNA methylase [Nostoc sp. XA013]|nr:N-6 DNA methylase [Nostoc sp. XA013]
MLVPSGKIRCYVHPDVLRNDTPEEHVRQRVARSLVEEYGYDREDLHCEFPIKTGGGKRRRLDIAIFHAGTKHQPENIFIIVEAKQEDVRPTDRKEGVDQLKSYMSVCVNAKWGLWVASEMQAFERTVDTKGNFDFPEATDIPLKGENEPKRLQFSELVPATEGLRGTFKRCHNYLHVNGNLTKEKAFFELLKLIFCKVYDEQETSGVMEFSITQEERRSELGQRKLRVRIQKIFNAVKKRYSHIFLTKNEDIELDNRSLGYIVSELQKFNFQETTSDIKGEAYEEIVSVTSRRDHGAFFTPRNVCDMAVGMVLATYPSDKRLDLKVLDPACGTGGFLRAALIEIREILEERVKRKYGNKLTERGKLEVVEQLKRVCDENIYGIDKLAELVRAAQMNLAMHGDGSCNIYHANSLLPPGEWIVNKDKGLENISLESFDVVFTNPPFGSKLPIDDPYILDQFELSMTEAKAPRSSLPPEQLFVERCLGFLKPGGRMAIVLPDSILSNPGLAFIRRKILQNAYIIASIDLPRQMFARSDTHTMTSVLVLQKFTESDRRMIAAMARPPEYEIFMAIADKVGWDLRGNPVYVRTPEGEEVLRKTTRNVTSRNAKGEVIEISKEVEEPIIDDQLPAVTQLFKNWLERKSPRWLHV